MRVVIVGGGFAGLEAALALRAHAGAAAEVTLIAPDRPVRERPIGSAARDPELVGVPLGRLAECTGARFVPGRVREIRPDLCSVVLNDGGVVSFDHCLVATGAARHRWLEAPGITFRGPRDSGRMADIAAALRAGSDGRSRMSLAFVVPAGPGWPLPAYELALLVSTWLHGSDLRGRVALTVVTAEDDPLGVLGVDTAELAAARLGRADVDLLCAASVRAWRDGHLELTSGRRVPADLTVSLPLVRGPRLAGLPGTQLGFVAAEPDGRVVGTPGVWVAGDAGPGSLKHAGLACLQADAVVSRLLASEGLDVPVVDAPCVRSLCAGSFCTGADGTCDGHRPGPERLFAGALWWPGGRVAGEHLGHLLAGTRHPLRVSRTA